ncbi:MAG TPA: MFS transporter [Steroidobacteraceae bacterium]|nr:MFS transporter [Steroidobacteraceae bacterium]
MNATTGSAGYQVMLATLLSLNFGIVFFDRNAANFLMPFIQPDLGLNNTQVGLLASALSLTWALAAFGIGVVSDKTGSRKGLLILATLAFSVCSFLTGIASGFALMLAARLLMGVAEGGIMPISQALIALEVEPRHRGLAMGVTQNFGSNLLGSFVAPVALAAFAGAFGWRHAFFLAGLPGLVTAVLIWFLVRDAAPHGSAASRAAGLQAGTLREALAERNVLICAGMGALLVSYLVVCWAFMPLYLTQVRKYDPQTASWLMGTLGISATVGAFVISSLSDRWGRKPLLIAMPLIAVILPLGALYFDGSVWGLAAIFFVGWGVNGVFPLFMATVPSESVAPHHLAAALGICMGTGEILGGVLAPSLAGNLADRTGLQAPLWVMLAVAVAGALLALGLRETAPRVLARRGGGGLEWGPQGPQEDRLPR